MGCWIGFYDCGVHDCGGLCVVFGHECGGVEEGALREEDTFVERFRRVLAALDVEMGKPVRDGFVVCDADMLSERLGTKSVLGCVGLYALLYIDACFWVLVHTVRFCVDAMDRRIGWRHRVEVRCYSLSGSRSFSPTLRHHGGILRHFFYTYLQLLFEDANFGPPEMPDASAHALRSLPHVVNLAM